MDQRIISNLKYAVGTIQGVFEYQDTPIDGSDLWECVDALEEAQKALEKYLEDNQIEE